MFDGSRVEVASSLTLAGAPSTLILNDANLVIDPGAYARFSPVAGAVAPALLLEGDGLLNIWGGPSTPTVFNQGQIVLEDLGTVGTTGMVPCDFINRPNAVVSSTGMASITGTAGAPLIFDNDGLVRCDGGKLKLGPGITWMSDTGVSKFKTTAPGAM